MPTDGDDAISGTAMQRSGDEKRVIAVCTECGFVQAVRAGEGYQGTDEDPAFRHYRQTDHAAASFEPADGSPLEEQWEIANGDGDWSELLANKDLFDLATGVEE